MNASLILYMSYKRIIIIIEVCMEKCVPAAGNVFECWFAAISEKVVIRKYGIMNPYGTAPRTSPDCTGLSFS